ncbi:DUF255 domain-containing protein [bacterium]|nr:DUF255 domain-containing protein [bacterium]
MYTDQLTGGQFLTDMAVVQEKIPNKAIEILVTSRSSVILRQARQKRGSRRYCRCTISLPTLAVEFVALPSRYAATMPGRSTFMPLAPEQIRREGNRLKHEASAYLRQHAYNPMDWYPWGEEALGRAREENRPIFLSIGYSSCHWCHVMERESFENDQIAAFMNENYINIKVDREERPDLDTVYMDAVQALTGSGGWPMSVWLTPDLRPFYGGTYLPAPQFLQVSSRLIQLFNGDPDTIESQANRLREVIEKNPRGDLESETKPGLALEAVKDALRMMDSKWGGFGTQNKFPTPLRWQYVLHVWRKTGDAELEQAVRLTLDRMMDGGLFDQIGGGFHRYTVERTWLVPHFEKMLYDNAQLASLYLEAGAVLDDEAYSRTARDTLHFLRDEMAEPDGGFYGSFDADSDGVEGAFYVWEPNEMRQVAGKIEGKALERLLGITKEGNFEGKSIPTRRVPAEEVAKRSDLSVEEVEGLLRKWRKALRKTRAGRVPPGLDKKMVTSWNGLTIAAFAQAEMLFPGRGYLDTAEKAAERMWALHRREDGSLWRSSTEGTPRGDGILDDYACLAWGLLELYRACGVITWFERAVELIEYTLQHFTDEKGIFYFTHDAAEAPLGRKVELMDSVEPSGSAMMVQVLLRASALNGNNDWHDHAGRLLAAYRFYMERAALEMAWWLDAALLYEGPFYEVVIAGANDRRQRLRRAYCEAFPTHSILACVGPDGPNEREETLQPPLAGKASSPDGAVAYVCQYGSCLPPVEDNGELKELLLREWHR